MEHLHQSAASLIVGQTTVPLKGSKMCSGTSVLYSILFFLVCAGLLLHKRGRLDLDKIPMPPVKALTGHMTQLLAPNFHRVFTAWAETYGTVYRISILGFPGVVVSDPAIIGQLLGYGTEGGELPKNVDSYQQLDRVSRCADEPEVQRTGALRRPVLMSIQHKAPLMTSHSLDAALGRRSLNFYGPQHRYAKSRAQGYCDLLQQQQPKVHFCADEREAYCFGRGQPTQPSV